jgi:hypothetical protein
MAQIDTGMTDAQVADFIENKLVPELNKRGRNVTGASYWSAALRNKQINCSHQWRNLATIIGGFCVVYGISYGNILQYCAVRGNYQA